MTKGALGIIETYGELAVIEAADQALKAANVHLLGLEKVKGGLVTISLVGEVAAIKASVDAGVAAVENLGIQVWSHVIPRPIEDLWDMLPKRDEETEEGKKEEKPKQPSSEENQDKKETEKAKTNFLEEKEKELSEMRVVDLRSLARDLETKIPRSDIKFANKQELLEALMDYYKSKEEIDG